MRLRRLWRRNYVRQLYPEIRAASFNEAAPVMAQKFALGTLAALYGIALQ